MSSPTAPSGQQQQATTKQTTLRAGLPPLVGISHARVSGLSDAPLRALVPLFAAAIREGEAMIDVAHNSSNVAAARDNEECPRRRLLASPRRRPYRATA